MVEKGGIIGPIIIRSRDEKTGTLRFGADRQEEPDPFGEEKEPQAPQEQGDPFSPVRDVVKMGEVERATLSPEPAPEEEGLVPMVASDAFDPEPPVGPDGTEIDLDELWFRRHQRMLERAFEPMKKSLEREGEISLRLGYNPPLMLDPKLDDQVFSSLRKLMRTLNGGKQDETQ